jgi:hypothetical protein
MIWLHGDGAEMLDVGDLVPDITEADVNEYCRYRGLTPGARIEREVQGGGIVNWHGELRPSEAIVGSVMAGARVTIDGVGRYARSR